MASKRKVNLNDYELTTTLGTGKFHSKILAQFLTDQLLLSCLIEHYCHIQRSEISKHFWAQMTYVLIF